MEVLTGLFIVGLYKATEKIWEKGFDAAWEPVGEALKGRFTRWAGRDKETERQAAFARAAKVARANTLRHAADPQQAEKILDALNGERDKRGAEALAEEAAKLMLFSAAPDVPRLTEICHRTLRFENLFKETPPPPETVAAVLSDFLTNLREALLDQEPYHELIQREMLRTLRQIVAELRPVAYDDEATYRAQVAEMYRQLEFVGIPELKERRPITVEDIFIRLRAEWEAESEVERELLKLYRQLEKRGDREKLAKLREVGNSLLREARSSLFDVPGLRLGLRASIAIEETLQETKRLVVLGDPGAGKTTVLKYLAVICAEGRAPKELGLTAGTDGGSPLPIFVPLREFAAECAQREYGRGASRPYSLLDHLYTCARERLLLNLPPGFFEEALDEGRGLVCLDGLDEVWAVGQRQSVRDAVKALAARYPRSRYLVTSRIVGYEEAPLDRRDFVHHTILPFEDDDIRQFVRKWYEARERDPVQRKQKVNDLIATVEREPRIKSLATNPLLLTIIALVHRIEAELPHERVKLYDKCVTALVETWEEVKGLSLEEKQRPFYRYRRRLLERLAYELHTRAEEPGQLQTVKEGDLELLLSRFLMENRRLGFADDPDGARDEARAFIHLARGRTGLLVERGEGAFGFPHLTFQEYLAACDIENRCIHRGVKAIWEEIEDHLHDPHWREVILLLLGSLNKYDEPPTLLVERILETGQDDKYEPVLHRHLYLTARALADRVDVANELHWEIISSLLTVARQGSWLGTSSLSFNEVHAKGKGERADALAALGSLEGDIHAAEGLLALALGEEVDALVRSAAASALGQLGYVEEAAEVLLALARDGKVDAAAFALGQLGRTEEKALDGLLTLAHDEKTDTLVRSAAASALGQLGHTEEAARVLLALAHNEKVKTEVRRTAVAVLGQLGRTEEKALDGLLTLAHDEKVAAWVCNAAASALGRLGRTEEAAEVLLALARDGGVDTEVRHDAASALGQLGRTEEKVLDGLLALARDEKAAAWVRSAAASALGELGRAEEATGVLLALTRDEKVEDSVRRTAAFALGQLGRTEEKVLDGLLALAHDEKVDAWVRSAAASALGQLGRAEEAAEVLLTLACDEKVDALVRRDAASALGQLDRAKEAAKILLALAHDKKVQAWVRYTAVSVLGRLGRTEETAEVLLALARDEKVEAGVRSEAASALSQLGRAEEAAEILLELTLDEEVDTEVRGSAYGSLKALVGMATD
jgi:tetratricopeptide (TPR) repeat protein/energy-coupling factor transporter ATP-binding protein EcfA2